MSSRPGSPSTSTGPRVGLVLAGGGIAGYGFHTGALAALEAATGWHPDRADIVLGTSAGSLVAALVRGGLDPAELRHRVLATGEEAETDALLSSLVGIEAWEWPSPRLNVEAFSLVTSELNRTRQGQIPRGAVLLAGLLPEGRVSSEALAELVRPFHAGGWPDRPLWITATDDQSGDLAVFGRDDELVWPDVGTAVQASCAIPGYFAPVRHRGRRYVDGGIRSADNAHLLVGQGLDIAVICSPLSIDAFEPPFSPVTSALRMSPRRRLGYALRALEAEGVATLVLEPDRHLSEAMGWTAMAARRLRPMVEASERHLMEQFSSVEGPDREVLDRLSASGRGANGADGR